MAKTKISEYDSTAANNTDIDGVNLAEGCPPSGINNAIRESMAHLKDFQTGASGDNLTVGGNLNLQGELQLNGSAGTSGQILTSQGSGADPIWSTSFLSGMLMMWTTGTAPSGWLLCNGGAVSRTTYSALFAVIGTTFGSGDGSTTFNLPDYRDRMPIGAGTTYSIAGTGGSKDAIVVSHTHTVSGTTGSGGSHNHTIDGQDNSAAPNGLTGELGNVENYGYGGASRTTSTHSGHTHSFSGTTSSSGSSGTNANLPPYIGIQFIIKT